MSDAAFPVGTKVRKLTGYTYNGTVVAVFETLAGQVRYVVENTGDSKGMLIIFNESQLGVVL